MANDSRDRDRDRSRNRGMFGYEGEGYMRGGGNDYDDFARGGYGRDNFGADRGYGEDRGYGSDRGGDDYTTGFSGGYGTGDRYGTGGQGRGGYGGGGYAGGGGSGTSGREDYMGGGSAGYDRSGMDYGRGRDFDRSGRDFDRGGFDRDDSQRGGGRNWGGGSGPDFSSGTDAGYRGGGNLGGDYRQTRGYRDVESPQQPQSYRGRGPKNYQRSDDRIREDVCERLAHDHDVDASDLEVNVSGGTVTITGSVNDRHAKRRAEDIAESVHGVKDVQNQIRVARESAAAGGTETSNTNE